MASSRRCCGLPLNLLSSSCPIDPVSRTVVSTCSRLLHSYMNAVRACSLAQDQLLSLPGSQKS